MGVGTEKPTFFIGIKKVKNTYLILVLNCRLALSSATNDSFPA